MDQEQKEAAREAFARVQSLVFTLALENGWWDDFRRRCPDSGIPLGDPELTPKAYLEKLMMTVTELCEASDEVRHGHMAIRYRESDGKPEGYPIEMADAVIRLFDLAEASGFNLFDAILIKHAYNATRPHRHGDLPF